MIIWIINDNYYYGIFRGRNVNGIFYNAVMSSHRYPYCASSHRPIPSTPRPDGRDGKTPAEQLNEPLNSNRCTMVHHGAPRYDPI